MLAGERKLDTFDIQCGAYQMRTYGCSSPRLPSRGVESPELASKSEFMTCHITLHLSNTAGQTSATSSSAKENTHTPSLGVPFSSDYSDMRNPNGCPPRIVQHAARPRMSGPLVFYHTCMGTPLLATVDQELKKNQHTSHRRRSRYLRS